MTVSLTEIKIIDTTEELALCYPLMKQLRINLTREDFLNVLKKAGFKNTKAISLTFGIASLYVGNK